REIGRALAVLIVGREQAEIVVADVNFRGVVLLRPGNHAHAGVPKQPFEIRVEFSDFLNVHSCLHGRCHWICRPTRSQIIQKSMDFAPGFSSHGSAGLPPHSPTSCSIWSMARAGSAQPASPTTRAGTPATAVFGRTDLRTT